jgi:hypothetical protein
MAMNSRDLDASINEPMRLPMQSVVRELTDLLGRKTVAYLAGLSSVREVVSWLGGAEPRPERAAVLRSALQAARYIALLESRASASAWFVGTNTLFRFESPAAVLRERGMEGRKDVVLAAQAFVAEALAASKGAEVEEEMESLSLA